MARRKSPSPPKGLNVSGTKLKALRLQAGLLQSDVVARLQLRGWAELNEPIFSMIERGKRGLSDWELKLILDALGARWRDLES